MKETAARMIHMNKEQLSLVLYGLLKFRNSCQYKFNYSLSKLSDIISTF